MQYGSHDKVLVTKYLNLDGIDLSTDEHVFLRFQTSARRPVTFQMDATFVSTNIKQGVTYGMTVLILM